MDSTRYLLVLAGMVAATYISRFPMLYFAGRRELPGPLTRVLQYVPPAVLIAITVPAVLIQDDQVDISIGNEYLIASLVTVLCAWLTKRMILSIVAGMLALWGWRFILTLLAAA